MGYLAEQFIMSFYMFWKKSKITSINKTEKWSKREREREERDTES